MDYCKCKRPLSALDDSGNLFCEACNKRIEESVTKQNPIFPAIMLVIVFTSTFLWADKVITRETAKKQELEHTLMLQRTAPKCQSCQYCRWCEVVPEWKEYCPRFARKL